MHRGSNVFILWDWFLLFQLFASNRILKYQFSKALVSHFIAATVSSNDIDIEKLKSQLPEGILPEGFNSSALPTADDAKKLFKEKCQKVSNDEEAFAKAENATEVLRECLMNLVDFETMQKEIEAATPNGDLDTVFNKWVHEINNCGIAKVNFKNC